MSLVYREQECDKWCRHSAILIGKQHPKETGSMRRMGSESELKTFDHDANPK